MQTSGASRRENADAYFRPRLRLIQYSRDVNDRTEKPQRTGSPAFAEDDSIGAAMRVSRLTPAARSNTSPGSAQSSTSIDAMKVISYFAPAPFRFPR